MKDGQTKLPRRPPKARRISFAFYPLMRSRRLQRRNPSDWVPRKGGGGNLIRRRDAGHEGWACEDAAATVKGKVDCNDTATHVWAGEKTVKICRAVAQMLEEKQMME
jgi:hypothetical protein